MKQYTINYKYSKDENSWTSRQEIVTAESDLSAIEQIKSKHPYVKDIKIINVR